MKYFENLQMFSYFANFSFRRLRNTNIHFILSRFFLHCQKKSLKSEIIGEILNSKHEFKITLSKTMNRQ